MDKQVTWVIVANSSRATIYQLGKFPKISEVKSFDHQESRLKDSEITTSAPGRGFQSGGVTRHAYESKTDPKEVEIEKFARIISDYLSSSFNKGEFSRFYLIANPTFLGLLRKYIHPKVHATVVAELPKDMTEHSKADIEEHLAQI